MFRYCETGKERRKIVIFDPPSRIKILWYHKLSETQKSFFQVCWFCETTNFRRKVVIPPPIFLSKKLLDTRDFWNTKWFTHIFIATVRRKDSQEKWETLSPLTPVLFIIFLDTKKFLKHRSVPLRFVPVLWDNNFWQTVVTVSPLHPFFSCLQYFW